MACCTMQPEDAALPRGDAEGDGEVYHKNDDESSVAGNAVPGFGGMVSQLSLWDTQIGKKSWFTEQKFLLTWWRIGSHM